MGTKDDHQIPISLESDNYDKEANIYAPIPKPHKKSSKCFVYLLALFVFVCTISLGFAIFVYPKDPQVQIFSVTAKNLNYSRDATKPYFNVTLDGEVGMKNSNWGPFEFNKTSFQFLYGDEVIGEHKIFRGDKEVKARGHRVEKFVVNLSSRSLRFDHEDTNLKSDLDSWLVKLNCYGEFSGSVLLAKFAKTRTGIMNCTMILDLTSNVLTSLVCNQ